MMRDLQHPETQVISGIAHNVIESQLYRFLQGLFLMCDGVRVKQLHTNYHQITNLDCVPEWFADIYVVSTFIEFGFIF